MNVKDLYLFHLSDDYSLLSDVPDAVRLQEDSEEYNEVTAEFFSGLSAEQNNVQIVKVSRIAFRSSGWTSPCDRAVTIETTAY